MNTDTDVPLDEIKKSKSLKRNRPDITSNTTKIIDHDNKHEQHTHKTQKQNQRSKYDQQIQNIPTASQFIIPPSEYLTLPPELEKIDFTKRISWRKFHPYENQNNPKNVVHLNYVPPNTKPAFSKGTSGAIGGSGGAYCGPALEFHVHALSKRARATTLHIPVLHSQSNDDDDVDHSFSCPRRSRSIPTPIFMPVGTKGTIKSLTTTEIMNDDALSCPIILGNTYHLALQPGTELINEMGGLHNFMQWTKNDNGSSCEGRGSGGAILTDSGGFQMVSLLKLAEITEEGVTFENPFEQDEEVGDEKRNCNDDDDRKMKEQEEEGEMKTTTTTSTASTKKRMLLRPEDSITHQNNIGSDIIMALDDVVSSVTDNHTRFQIATYRTLRWLDRCFSAHTKPSSQNLFAIVQGGLDTSIGGLREQCLAGFMVRDDKIPGYAIGGLAGGESKDHFWKVVDQCCKALPDDKPRYLMGVGYPLDLVVCTALGVDMYDCVYPTRTARFGVALVPTGTIRLKSNEYSNDDTVIMDGCQCQACSNGYAKSQLHIMLKRGNPLATTLMTHHNIAYMMVLVRGMRKAIMEDRYEEYVNDFLRGYYVCSEQKEEVPQWVRDALDAAGIALSI